MLPLLALCACLRLAAMVCCCCCRAPHAVLGVQLAPVLVLVLVLVLVAQ